MGRSCPAVAVVLLVCLAVVGSYHTSINELVKSPHCWPLDANDENDEPIDCGGLVMQWKTRPKTPEVTVGDPLLFTINITSTESELDDRLAALCGRDCRADCNVTPEECCVWRASLLTCSLAPGDDFQICLPWSEHSIVQTQTQCGPFGSYNASIILKDPGFMIVIYHLQVGNISIALGDYLNVKDTVCGDEMCHETVEDCSNCAFDCCPAVVATGITAVFLLVVVTATVVVTLSIAGGVVYRKKRRIRDESWIINFSDIITNPGRRAMSSLHSLNKRRGSTGGSLSSALDLQNQQIFTEIGAYGGKTVAIRRIRVKRSLFGGCGGISSQLKKEVFQIRYLEHQNLCKFIGATVKDPLPNIAIISEYCSKGSLNDVLLNDDVPLTWNFRFSFAGDIARGMAFLHSHGITHGRLTSSNCVIDDRWVTKVTDYGLPALRYGEEEEEEEEEGGEVGDQVGLQRNVPKVYRAPEVRDLPPNKPSSSQPADMYSYAVILYEIATGMDPRSENTWQLDANMKPKINQSQLNSTVCPCSQDYLNLINKCWTFSPQTRLTFDRVRRELRAINPSNTSAIDNMMQLMEKYSKHLEQLVSERTAELEVEKEKATDLLYRMIPQAVAEELKNGKTVEAEEFKGVTIFFSDIVGFTTLAGDSSPMQIVGLLNKLYTEFDTVLDQFDVYKVETIGDAYMVVSGVPRPNGDRHAGEIAKMALQLMACCENFTVPHKPETHLQIRAGIHSGSVCAGIVGVKMPRYCLFGDTVNTASRMESNSQAMSIQCSDATYQLLERLGGFTLENRGIISVKGKGAMNTWWLKGYTEPDGGVLPPPPRQDTQVSPTTKEPIRDAPKKLSSVSGIGEKPLDTRAAAGLQRGPSSAALDLYKIHKSLQTSSFTNLLSADDVGGRENTQKRAITMSRESTGCDTATNSPPRQPVIGPASLRHSVPHVMVGTFPSGVRRMTTPNVETVGLSSAAEGRKTSAAGQLTLAPLDGNNESEL